MKDIIDAFNVEVGDIHRYEVNMDCIYLERNGSINKVTSLESIIRRTIKKNRDNKLLFTDINWEKCSFRGSRNDDWMNWNFPLEINLEHNLFIAVKEEDKERFFQGNAYNRANDQTDNLSKAFDKYPKLPSVYLIIMQAFDMIGMESFVSFILSNPEIFNNPRCYVESKELSHQSNSLGLGHYANKSFFKNGSFFFKYMGMLKYDSKDVYSLEYYCNGSEVSMLTIKEDEGKTGRSYYEGSIFIDSETGLLVYGSMHEHYIGSQKIKKSTVNSQVIRRIEIKEID